MCGIAGIYAYNDFSSEINFIDLLDKMSFFIKNRGPEFAGKWISQKDKIGIIHSRLSIVGIDENGNQPLISRNGRYVMSFNGEIYNFRSLKNQLSNKFNAIWKGSSDSEVLLEGISLMGFEEFLSKCDGMFAIAIWDKKLKKLILARDRIGEKPLYFAQIINNNLKSIVFSSDIGSFTVLGKSKLIINKLSLVEFINNGWIYGEKTIYEDVKKVMPGEMIEINLSEKKDLIIQKKLYWEFNHKNYDEILDLSFQETTNKLNNLLINVLEEQLYCEREKAIFFSGGIDSSLIAAISKKEFGEKINCITCGFSSELDSNSFDETTHAENICKYLNLTHIKRKISSKDIIDSLPQMASIFSEPFADISQIGTYLISKKARDNGIIVALGGDGGDELFGGYQRYLSGPNLLRLKKIIPYFFVESLNKNLNFMPRNLKSTLGKILGIDNLQEKIEKIFLNYENIYDVESLYLSCLSKWDSRIFNQLGLGSYNSLILSENQFKENANVQFDERYLMMAMDIKSFLVDDVLVKTDRASMSLGLEVRSPFLNHNIVDFASSIPINSKFDNHKGKAHLRKILEKYIDKKLINRPKKGFSIPIDQILRTSAKEWSFEMINYLKYNNEFSLNIKLIENLWQDHLSGKSNNGNCLWNIIMLSSWMQVWRK